MPKSIILLSFGCLFFLNSCVTQRRVEYLQGKKSMDRVFENKTFEEYLLRPTDELFIQITNFDDATNFLSNAGGQGPAVSDPFGASLQSHSIDKDGFLELPIIGRILVKDKTIPQVRDIIKESLVGVLNQPIITIKLVNRYISVLGEVKMAGHFPYTQEKLSIFDALSLAGDISEYGNRKEVILLRHVNGKTIKKTINLEKTDILQMEYYYLQPNDILYIKPLSAKIWNRRTANLTILLTITNVVLLFFNYNK